MLYYLYILVGTESMICCIFTSRVNAIIYQLNTKGSHKWLFKTFMLLERTCFLFKTTNNMLNFLRGTGRMRGCMIHTTESKFMSQRVSVNERTYMIIQDN